ncbi:MAG: hypothetical protein WCH21_04055, partial [Bacteroidota bacterium]
KMFNRYLLLPLVALIIVASSCSSNFSITKRKYMKGYHVDFAKNKAVKNNQLPETKINEVKIHSLVKETVAKEEELYASNTEIAADNKNKTSIKNISAVKKFKALTLNNGLSKAFNETKTIKNTILKPLAEVKTKLVKGLKAKTNNHKSVPFDSFCGGGGGNGSTVGMAILYFFGSILSILFFYALVFLIAAIIAGSAPSWVGGALLALAAVIVLAIIVVVIFNGD